MYIVAIVTLNLKTTHEWMWSKTLLFKSTRVVLTSTYHFFAVAFKTHEIYFRLLNGAYSKQNDNNNDLNQAI